MKNRVLQLLTRLSEVESILNQPDAYSDAKAYKALTQEHSYLRELKTAWDGLEKSTRELKENEDLLRSEKDKEFIDVLREEIKSLESKIVLFEKTVEDLLVPPELTDNRPTIVEIRAGTGGDEAALFVGDCVRMYKLFADSKGWKYEVLSSTPSEAGGFKEFIFVVSGPQCFRLMQYEAGTHRVQRVPLTEAQGRVHTSAITVAVLPEPEEDEEINLDERDLRIDTYRSSGAGGQHVNTTDSAVRITHLPTGIVVYCQDERSQHKNKAKAMRHLQAKIAEVEKQKQLDEISSTRAAQVGSGDRSERIRTYNFPQNRLTDHRINLTKYNLDHVMEGDLEEFVLALVKHYYQLKLSSVE